MTEHVTDRLSTFIDGQLADADRRAVETHVERCTGCARELQELRALARLLARTPKQALPAGFRERLERRRKAEEAAAAAPARRRMLPLPARALALGMSAAVVFLVAYDVLKGPGRVDDRLRDTAPMAEPSADDLQPEAAHAVQRERKVSRAPGSPVEVAEERAAEAAVTNEQLQARLEAEKRRMGITAIVPPASRHAREPIAAEPASVDGPPPMTAAQARLYMRKMAEGLARQRMAMGLEPDAVPLGAGTRPKLLAKPVAYQGSSAGGAPLALGPAAAPRAAPELPAGPQARAAKSQDELERLWRELVRSETPPAVDFASEMVVAVYGPRLVQIVDVNPVQEHLFVRYREDPDTPGPSSSVRVVPKSDLPIELQLVP